MERAILAQKSKVVMKLNKAKGTVTSAYELKTRVFELRSGKYTNLSELARVIGISVSEIYRVRQGTRPISQKFISGAIKAFPGYKLDDLFYVAREESQNDCR